MLQVKQGEHPAFETLFNRWRQPIWAFLLRRLGNAALAEDAFQECWSRLWRFRARYEPGRPFRPWLYAVAANSGHDQWARATPADFSLDAAAQAIGSDGRASADARAMLEAIFTLEGKDRTVILLTAEGFDPSEIAAMLDQDANAIRARLSRARQKLRIHMGP